MINKLVIVLLKMDGNIAKTKLNRNRKLIGGPSSSDGPPAKKRPWREGLLETMQDPNSIVAEDDKVVVIRDKYPKARHHYLVLPRANIPSINEVGKEHVELLEHMEKIGQKVADEINNHEFVIGYHAVPSMHRLHLHVISTDFDSPCLKTKYHWNSFTTPYFRPSKTVREELKKHGMIVRLHNRESDGYLRMPLRCHKCSFNPKNLPELKRHLRTHLS